MYHQYIGAANIPVILIRFSFQVVPAFRSFQLSGRSGFLLIPVILAFRSFQGNPV
jgi:hypothetical protein